MQATFPNTLVRVLLAPVCAGCRAPLARPLDSPVCDRCWSAVELVKPPWCVKCGDALLTAGPSALAPRCPRCRDHPRNFELARSAGRYAGPLRDLIHAFKYQRRRMLAMPLAALVIRTSGHVLAGADAVVPVPLHPWRAYERGFNQADDLACRLGPPVWRVLRRHRPGVPQASLPADRRPANVDGAFTRRGPFTWTMSRHDVRHRTLVLIDDVMTTGATLDACSEVLLRAGAKSVRALTVARAVAGQQP